MNRIKEVISEKGYTITELAKEMGIKRETLSRNIKSPSSNTLERLSKALGVPVWQFFASPNEVQKFVCPTCGTELRINIENND